MKNLDTRTRNRLMDKFQIIFKSEQNINDLLMFINKMKKIEAKKLLIRIYFLTKEFHHLPRISFDSETRFTFLKALLIQNNFVETICGLEKINAPHLEILRISKTNLILGNNELTNVNNLLKCQFQKLKEL